MDYSIIHNNILFKDLSELELKYLLDNINYRVADYQKGEIIAIEGDTCLSVGIVLKGTIEVQKLFQSGEVFTLKRLKQGNLFGEVIVFSEAKVYPSTIVAVQKSTIFFLNRVNILKSFDYNKKVLNNFIGVLSNRILMLNNRIKNISFKSIRQKIVNFLLEYYKKTGSNKLILPYTRLEMSEYLGVPRPSLSRELQNLKNENYIDYKKNIVNILDLKGLFKLLS